MPDLATDTQFIKIFLANTYKYSETTEDLSSDALKILCHLLCQ